MCGINGFALTNRAGKRFEEIAARRMRDVLRHRGPDDAGTFSAGNVCLGHRRLSIVDVAHGAQPMHSQDKSLTIVYNGEIYNHREHRPELESKGYRFQTTCDTETILYLYEEYDARCLERLRGMFAFAVWNEREKSLFIARDRFGVKPLYYVQAPCGSLFFASEIKSLLASGAIEPELNYNALPDQLANHGTSGDETLFKNVKRLAPGHFMTWRDGVLKIEKYWDLSFEPKREKKTDAEAVEEWRELFKESVKLRLMADVPLGMFLSGGIDSSAICAVMSEMVSDPIKTFSVGFKEREANEFRYARLVAEAFKTDHHEITVTPEEFFDELPNLVWQEDEPLGFIASVPLYFVSKLAQKHVKVVLTGEGSDEILGGYGRYGKTLALLKYGAKYESLVPGFVRKLVRNNIENLPLSRKLKRTFLARPADLENLYFDNFAVFPKAIQARLFTAEALGKIENRNPYAALQNHLAQTDARDTLDRLLYADTKTYLHELLMKQDQMSMAASIESRVPFLDYKLAEYTARLPERMKIRGRETKWILREAMRGVLPDEILTRGKMGFPVPVGAWFRNEFRHVIEEYVLSDRARNRGVFDAQFVSELVAEHDRGENHDERLWFLVNFEIWQRQFFDGEAAKRETESAAEELVLI